MRKFLPISFMILTFIFSSFIQAESMDEVVFFGQVVNGQETIYSCKYNGTNLRRVVSGKNIPTFLVGKHFLYFTGHQLFEYDLAAQKSRGLAKFKEDKISIQKLSKELEAPDQALILAETEYEIHFYVLEFSDGSARLVQNPLINSNSTAEEFALKGHSPDENGLAIIQAASFNYCFELSIQEKVNGKFKTTWTLPRDLTVIPETPIWSPNSRMVAFYARKSESLEGFYSFYIYNLDTKELRLVQEQVFSKMFLSTLKMGSFEPDWSKDSRYIVFQYQPYGLPTESSIIKYDVQADYKSVLTNSGGHLLNPKWSPSGRNILFLSNREEASKDQVYMMDGNGEKVWRLSPLEGYTKWAQWYEPKL